MLNADNSSLLRTCTTFFLSFFCCCFFYENFLFFSVVSLPHANALGKTADFEGNDEALLFDTISYEYQVYHAKFELMFGAFLMK